MQLLADLDAQYNAAPPVQTPGDFNGNTFVNATDLSQWQGDYGLNGDSDADEDGDSDSDSDTDRSGRRCRGRTDASGRFFCTLSAEDFEQLGLNEPLDFLEELRPLLPDDIAS